MQLQSEHFAFCAADENRQGSLQKGLYKRPYFVEDVQRVPNTYKDIIIKSFVLGKYFKRHTPQGEPVALLLPNSIAAVCAFFGLSAYERIPVMLNFSVGAKNMASMCRTAEVRMVITSSTFIKTAKMESVIEVLKANGLKIVYLESLRKEIGLWSKINAYLRYKIKRVPHKDGGNKKRSFCLPPVPKRAESRGSEPCKHHFQHQADVGD